MQQIWMQRWKREAEAMFSSQSSEGVIELGYSFIGVTAAASADIIAIWEHSNHRLMNDGWRQRKEGAAYWVEMKNEAIYLEHRTE